MTILPSGWHIARLADVALVIQGQAPKGKSYNTQGHGLPLFQGKAEFGDLHPTVRKWTTTPTKVSEAGDILLSIRAPVGPTNIAPVQCCIGRGLAAIRANQGTDQRYLLHFLRWHEPELAATATGTTFGAVSGSQIRDIEVPLPALDEQRRIVLMVEEQLSRLEAGSAGVDTASRKLASYELALLHAATLGRLTAKDRWPAVVAARGPSEDALPQLPDQWRWAKLESLADVVGGVAKDTKKQSGADLLEVPYLRVANVQRGRLDLREVATIRVPAEVANRLTLVKGDVLMNEGGDRDKLGRGWVWQGQIPNCIHQNHVFRVRIRDGILDPRFLSWHGNTFGQAWFQREGKQTTNLASISLNRLRQLPVPVPPLNEQRVIVGEVDRRFSVTAAIRTEIGHARSKANRLKAAILEAAFTGGLSASAELRQAGPVREALAGVLN
jgi:type I restriction enzyme S subunit